MSGQSLEFSSKMSYFLRRRIRDVTSKKWANKYIALVYNKDIVKDVVFFQWTIFYSLHTKVLESLYYYNLTLAFGICYIFSVENKKQESFYYNNLTLAFDICYIISIGLAKSNNVAKWKAHDVKQHLLASQGIIHIDKTWTSNVTKVFKITEVNKFRSQNGQIM